MYTEFFLLDECQNQVAKALAKEYGESLQDIQLQPLKELRAALCSIAASRSLASWRPYLEKEILGFAEKAQELPASKLEKLITAINTQIKRKEKISEKP